MSRSPVLHAPGQPIRNILRNDLTISNNANTTLSGAGAQNLVGDTTIKLFGSASFKVTRASGQGTGACGIAILVENPSGFVLGDKIPVSLWVRAEAALTASLFAEGFKGATYFFNGGGSLSNAAVAANTWVRLSTTLIVNNANAVGATSFYFSTNVNNVPEGVACYFHAANAFLNTEAQPTYCGVGVPSWKYTGTAGLSPSVGYPYTLESIAGKPLDVNSTPNSLRPPLALDPMSGRSLYVVSDVFDTTISNKPLAALGSSSPSANSDLGALIVRTAGAGLSYFQARIRSMDDALNQTVNSPTQAAVRSVGRHTYHARMSQGLTSAVVMADGGFTPGTGYAFTTPGNGMRNPAALGLGLADTHDAPVAAYAWGVEHNDETAKRVTAWLARRYGSPIPAGY